MEVIMDWVSSHTIEILTFLLVCITGYYAFLTSRYVRLTRQALEENRQMRLDAQKPQIAIYLDSYTETWTFIDFYVENIGVGSAYGVEFSGDLSIKLNNTRSLEKEVPILRTGISYLAPRQKRKYQLGKASDLHINELKQKPLKITVTYKDSVNKKYKEPFCLNFREHFGG